MQTVHNIDEEHGRVEGEAPQLPVHTDGVAREQDGRLAL